MSRELSHWGWGWADRFPDREARTALGEQVGAVLGLPVRPPADPAPLASINVPRPRVVVPTALADVVSDADEPRLRHTYGRAWPDLVRGFRGDFSGAPDLVAFPRSRDDVVRLVRWASQAGVAVIPYGGGTSVVRGVEPEVGEDYEGTLSLDLGGLDRIVHVDPVSRLARIQAGIRGPALEEGLAPHGLTLRHYPQSFEHSTLGGWLVTRSGGHFATGRTHIDDFVAAMEVVTPSGQVETRRLPASGAGPDPMRLWLGSEGTLGVVTEATMRVRPRPRWRSAVTVHFADWDQAVAGTRAVAQSGLDPATCRLLDVREAMLHGVSFSGTHLLLLGFESAVHPTRELLEVAQALATEAGGTVPEPARHTDAGDRADGDAASSWRQAFFDGPYLQTALLSLGVMVDTFETAVTWDRLPALHTGVVAAVRAAIQEQTGHKGFVSCRFTHVYPDGAAPYYTFVAPAPAGHELDVWVAIKSAASDTLVRLGATITHHHAVGRLHRPWYEAERPGRFGAVLAAVKAELDPRGVMNPGVLLDTDAIRRR